MTHEEAKTYFSYDPETGVLTRLVTLSNRAVAGTEVSCRIRVAYGKTYIQLQVKGRMYLAHRVIWLWVTGAPPSDEIDHLDGDGTNNRWDNLRPATRLSNMKNMRKRPTTYCTGVHWDKRCGKWKVEIMANRVKIHGGRFADLQEAIACRKALEVQHGFHENHGSDRPL